MVEIKEELFTSGEFIAKKGNLAENVYFISNGIVQNTHTKRFFGQGMMINHDVILNYTEIKQSYKAKTDVITFKYDKSLFKQILSQYPDINNDISLMLINQKQI